MRTPVFMFYLAISFSLFSQNNECNCVVSVTETYLSLALKTHPNEKLSPEYAALLPLSGEKTAYLKLVKDSAAYWFFQPHIRQGNHPIIKTKNWPLPI